MTLEDRVAFRESLLEHKPLEDWKQYRPEHLSLYRSILTFEGREIS